MAIVVNRILVHYPLYLILLEREVMVRFKLNLPLNGVLIFERAQPILLALRVVGGSQFYPL